MKTILVKLRLTWGYSTHYPLQSASQDTLPYPPPSTLIGALAASYAKVNGLPEISKDGTSTTITLLSKVRYAAFCLKGYGVKQLDPHRNVVVLYQRRERRGNRQYWYGLQAMGKVYSMNARAKIIYIVEDDVVNELAAVAWGITSIGCKEGLVIVDDVTVYDLSIESRRYCSTCYYVPASIVKDKPVNAVKTRFWDWRTRESYAYGATPKNTIEYYVPYNGVYYGCANEERMRLTLNDEGIVAIVGEEEVPIPRKILEAILT